MIFDELRAIQLRHRYLPKAELEALSRKTHTPLYQIHSVASFYPHFHLTPPARAEVHVCADMSCRLNGACELRAELLRRFAGAQPEDVLIKDVSCLGRCDQAPAVAINDEIFAAVTADQTEELARHAMRGEELDAEDLRAGRVACASDPYGMTSKAQAGFSEDVRYTHLRHRRPSSGYLPASMVNVRLDFKALADAGSDTGVGSDRGVRRHNVHAGYGADGGAFLPE